jgi:hypothetical protein
MNLNRTPDLMGPTPAGTYTPGYAGMKVAMILYGLLLVMVGLALIATPLRLMLFGKMTEAEATRIVKTEKGYPDVVLTNDEAVQASLETNNYRAIFWNEFEFQTQDGLTHSARCPVGSRLKPLFNLVDADGLPTMEMVYYNPKQPEQLVFPSILSTWFAPGVLIIAGLLGAVIGSVLYYWAKKPIVLPHLGAAYIV